MRTKTKQARENAKLDLESLRKLYFLRKNLLERYVKEQCRYEISAFKDESWLNFEFLSVQVFHLLKVASIPFLYI